MTASFERLRRNSDGLFWRMNPEGNVDDKDSKPTQPEPPVKSKKRKTEPEVTIAPTQPGGPDISVE